MTVEETVRGNQHEDTAPINRLHIESTAHCNSRRSSLKPTLTTVPSGVEMNSEDFEEVKNIYICFKFLNHFSIISY